MKFVEMIKERTETNETWIIMEIENNSAILTRTHRMHNLFEISITHANENNEIVTDYVITWKKKDVNDRIIPLF